jgi:hypothetical protein
VSAHTALCVGGPLNGQWKVVEGCAFDVVEPPKLDFTSTDSVIEPFTRHRYLVEPFSISGFSTWIALCEGAFMGAREINRAVLRAILQRDVAAQMGVL